MIDVKVISVFLPFLGALLYGISYALSEKALGDSSISTYMLVSCMTGMVATLVIHFLTPYKINFPALVNFESSKAIYASTVIMTCAWIVTLFAIKNVSANYASIGEISYPLFTVLFGYLIFSRKIDWSMALGALLIISGSFLIVSDKLKD